MKVFCFRTKGLGVLEGFFFHRIYTSETRGPPGLENGAFTGIIPFFPVV
jgi:hypothetical protein